MASPRGKKGGRTEKARIREAPLEELSRDQLSVFLYVALLPEETRSIVKDLGLSLPGFRTEALGDVERCDVIADEILAHPASASPVHQALGKAFEIPPLASHALDAPAADEILRACASDAALALALWRVLSDRDGGVRRAARPVLDELAHHYYAPPPAGAEAASGARLAPADPAERAADSSSDRSRQPRRGFAPPRSGPGPGRRRPAGAPRTSARSCRRPSARPGHRRRRRRTTPPARGRRRRRPAAMPLACGRSSRPCAPATPSRRR